MQFSIFGTRGPQGFPSVSWDSGRTHFMMGCHLRCGSRTSLLSELLENSRSLSQGNLGPKS